MDTSAHDAAAKSAAWWIVRSQPRTNSASMQGEMRHEVMPWGIGDAFLRHRLPAIVVDGVWRLVGSQVRTRPRLFQPCAAGRPVYIAALPQCHTPE